MTLATRCTACGTTFRVVQDQLRVSEGWVRCGRCNEVFSALESLSELPDPEPELAGEASRPETETVAPEHWRDGPDRADVLLDPPPPGDQQGLSIGTPAPPGLPERPAPPREIAGAQSGGADALAWPAALAADTAAPDDQVPAFVREAERVGQAHAAAGRWVALACAAGLLALAAQAVYAWRDAIAARVPATHPVLSGACEALGCSVLPWRMLDGLSVESSNLGQVGSTTIYQLSVVIRNRTRMELMPPALDLALTDSQGRTVARRVLSLGELGAPAGAMPPGGELALQARLSTGDRRITGYSLEIFHP